MIATLTPMFDNSMNVTAYSIFAQRANYFLNPGMLNPDYLDGAGYVDGFEIIDSMGTETISEDREVFVELSAIALFADLDSQHGAPHDRIVLLIDSTVGPEERNVERIRELKSTGYRFAMQGLQINQFEAFKQILMQMDYILLDHKRIIIKKAKIYFNKMYPNMKLGALNVDSKEEYEKLSANGSFDLYEGAFFRMPVTEQQTEVAPVKANYIRLLNTVNEPDYELTDAADVIGQDTALIISLLKMVNRMVPSEVSSVRQAAALLGQRELKKWINTAVTRELCADKPSEIIRMSLLRAKLCENLAPILGFHQSEQEPFLLGLFSAIDVMLDVPMEEALKKINLSKQINEALLHSAGPLYPLLQFMLLYENAEWTELSRIMVIEEIDMDTVYRAYLDALKWYRELFI
ncbi:MAG: HDOD domain-containing protein [Lachnospiraceae bacterium]|nr:HDOD domain-containing protein [Lachnospiraceae bacterium]